VCLPVALGIQQTKRMRIVMLLSLACLDIQFFFFHITHKRHDFRGEKSY
jgi:hypothetical protein